MNYTPSRSAYSNHTLSLRGVVLAGAVALALVVGCSHTTVPPPEATRSSSLRIVSYNVRYPDADADESQIQSHAEAVAADIRALLPDIACLQEVMTGLYPASIPSSPFRDGLADVLEGFSWAAARDDSHLEDANSVLYDPDRFTPIRQGLHWFSNTALSPGDGDTRRDLLPFQIDGIYVSPTLGVGWAAVDRHADASDHRPVVAELIYDAGSER